MILCHKYKFIYIKSPKAAGTSLELVLSRLCDDGDIISRDESTDEDEPIEVVKQDPFKEEFAENDNENSEVEIESDNDSDSENMDNESKHIYLTSNYDEVMNGCNNPFYKDTNIKYFLCFEKRKEYMTNSFVSSTDNETIIDDDENNKEEQQIQEKFWNIIYSRSNLKQISKIPAPVGRSFLKKNLEIIN